ncbi:MAG: protein kinase [Acidobacteria bacterium]|nr:protein kinase [Acidobacteriota bacterium]
MNPERMRQIEALFHKASALAEGERAELLARACAGDDSLREEVESLLAQEKAAEMFLEAPAFRGQMISLADGWESVSAALTGRTLGRYDVQERVGGGGMGVVYRALDIRLGRTVALKVLPPELTADAERRNRFEREARAASALNHPNIVTIFDIDRVEGIDLMAMEYIIGRTLQDMLACRELSASDAVNLGLQIAQALVAAHSAGIIHRDIKPANIMITGSAAAAYRVKVLDFGLAKLIESSQSTDTVTDDTAKGSIIGTAAYMSPEQAEGKPIDARSDIFSFGSLLHEMLSGRRAFRGESNLAILTAVLRETPEPLPGIPANLQQVVSRCLQKDRNLRFQSAAELQHALEACLPLSTALSPVKTIAVLPFANPGGDKDQEYFSDGLTEEIISALARLPGLRVTARTSAFAFRGKNLDVREIGTRLNVEHILEGSVRSSGNRVRVTAQVINAADGYQLWSERYDREMRDVLDIQDEISHAIVDTLRVHLAKDASLVKRHTDSPEAYSLYLRGRYHHERRTSEGFARARHFYEQAIAADAQYALAFLGLADSYLQKAFYGFQYPKEALAGAKEAATRALEMDDSLPEGHALLGTMLGIADCDWRAAESAFQRALELDANSPFVLFRYANFYLWPQGRVEEATALIERTLSVDPLWVLAHWVLSYYAYARRQYDRAVSHLHAVIEMEPAFYLAYCVLGLAYIQQGKLAEAIGALEKGCELCSGHPFTVGMLAYGLGKAGRFEEVRNIIERLREAERHSYVPAKSFMFAWAGLNDPDNVLVSAERSLDDRDPMTVMNLLQEPVLDFVRSDPRYPALLRKIHLQS